MAKIKINRYRNDDDRLYLFDACKVARDSYAAQYNSAKAEYKSGQENLDRNIRPGSDLWKKTNTAIKEKFNKSIVEAKNKIYDEIMDLIENERTAARQYCTTFDADEVETFSSVVSHLEGLPVTVDEIHILAETYGNANYWCDRMLERFAKDHGVLNLHLEPDLQTKLQVLDDLQGRIDKFFEHYGSGDLTSVEALHDATISKLESRFTGRYAGLSVSDERMVDAVVHKIYSQSGEDSKAATLVNILKTADEDVRELVLDRLVEDGKLSDTCLRLANATGIMQEHEKQMAHETAVKTEVHGIMPVIDADHPTTAEKEFDNKLQEDISRLNSRQLADAKRLSREQGMRPGEFARAAVDQVMAHNYAADDLMANAEVRASKTADPAKREYILQQARSEATDLRIAQAKTKRELKEHTTPQD